MYFPKFNYTDNLIRQYYKEALEAKSDKSKAWRNLLCSQY